MPHEGPEPLAERPAHLRGPRDQAVLLDVGEDRVADGGGEGIGAVGEAVLEVAAPGGEGVGDEAARDDRA